LQNYVEQMAKTVGVPIIDGESLDRAAEGAIEVIANRVLGSRVETHKTAKN
jgi:2-phosphoglycerate kinase